MRAGPRLRFAHNYFTLNDRPLFLFGTDTYARTYQSACENPATWLEELTAARDIGMNLYENLQYQRPNHQMRDEDWRKFRAMAQLCQARGLVFMPGMLIGHNTAISDGTARGTEPVVCGIRPAARRCAGTAVLHQRRLPTGPDSSIREAVQQQWRQFLRSRYASIEALQQAWGQRGSAGRLRPDRLSAGQLRALGRPCADGRRAVSHGPDHTLERGPRGGRARSIREHPITSEYYARPSEGIDLPLTIDAQDVSNIGYFDRPGTDIEQLPWQICFADLRARGKGVSLGEYGVKTHPAWQESNGATGYHIRRTEEQQKQLFAAVAHYALGMGCSKVQNWCLRDGAGLGVPLGHLLSAPVRGQGRGLRASQSVAGLAVPATAVSGPGSARRVWPTSCGWEMMARVG